MTRHRLVIGSLTLLTAGAAYHLVTGTPMAILGAAALPAAAWAVVILLIGHNRHPASIASVVAFVGGGLAAAGASRALNDTVLAWIVSILGAPAARQWMPVLVAPALEELAKAAVLVAGLYVWSAAFDDMLDGIVYGALIGLGFAMAENLDYFTLAVVQGGMPGLLRSMYVRGGLEGLIHPVCAAATGAGIGAAREARWTPARWAAPAIGLSAAIAQHAVWNGVASAALTTMLCAAATPEGPCQPVPPAGRLYIAAPLVIAAFLAPAIVTLGVILRSHVAAAAQRQEPSPHGATPQPRG